MVCLIAVLTQTNCAAVRDFTTLFCLRRNDRSPAIATGYLTCNVRQSLNVFDHFAEHTIADTERIVNVI